MDHGHTAEHFKLLDTWAGTPRQVGDPLQDRAYNNLVESYEATARWARAVQSSVFPNGWVRKLSKPTDQSQKFKQYTWARIYPRRGAPRGLAYTVGIDAIGEFCVKIDTVGLGGAQRRRYEQLLGSDRHRSSFVATLPATVGLAMSFEQLVDWSVQSIEQFEPGYDAIATELGLVSRTLRLVTDADQSRAAFARWRETLLDQSEDNGAVRGIFGHTVWSSTRDGESGPEVKLGLDPGGNQWGVEINAPPVPGDHNGLSAIAVDDSGGVYLLRQGWLRGRRPAPDVREQEFMESTGLAPVSVEGGGKPTSRNWFLVAALDDAPARIRRTTSEFAELCWAARTPIHATAMPPTDEPLNTGEKSGGNESSVPYWLPAKPASDPKLIQKLHGLVWQALAVRLSGSVLYRKWRRAGGYSIDMEVAPIAGPPLLIEIKTGCCTSDVHTGVGQLQLYRQLFPALRDHRAVLLIDAKLPAAMSSAVAALRIEVQRYSWSGEDGLTVEISQEMLALCGLAPNGAREL